MDTQEIRRRELLRSRAAPETAYSIVNDAEYRRNKSATLREIISVLSSAGLLVLAEGEIGVLLLFLLSPSL